MENTNTYLGGIDETTAASLVGKFIHVPQNDITPPDGQTVNMWFAGQVAGYEKAVIGYDYVNGEFFTPENVQVYFNVHMTDGATWVLSNKQLIIEEITEEKFQQMLTEHLAKQALLDQAEAEVEQIVTRAQNKILLPGEDF
ncbi:hypothetical protein ACP26L_36155 (plasmid) [Paenibacillus sp. S-38]|uniref:hypothetical protein n=1 Tax=Paenibacillus sp. S-38 TaxID=3416710 RepID=UPI003CF02BF0